MAVRLTTRQKIALGRAAQAPVILARRALGRGPEVRVRRDGLLWSLDLREGIDFAIFALGRFERSTGTALRGLVTPGDLVVDIGANIGAHTLPLARAVGTEGRVVAFEPTEFAYAKLCANIALNPEIADRITAEQVMLLDDPAAPAAPELFASWPLVGSADGHAKHGGRAVTTRGARATTLDAYLGGAGLGPVKLIKLDVDGYECAVLRGARRTLETDRPPLVMELAPYVLEERGTSLEELLRILHGAGYRLARENTGAPLPAEADGLRALLPDGASINVLARPG